MENMSCQTLGVSFKMNVCFMAVCCVSVEAIPRYSKHGYGKGCFGHISWLMGFDGITAATRKDRTRKATDVYVEVNATHVARGWSVLTEIHH